MPRFIKKREESRGLAPGSLIFIGTKKVDELDMIIIDYDDSNLDEIIIDNIKAGAKYKDTNTVSWINVNGLHNVDAIKEIGKIFSLHPLLLEDILNTGQRPKMEEFENNIFITLKMLRIDEDNDRIISEQLSLVLGDKFIITFQEQPGDVFEAVRNRIRTKKGRIRKAGVDYLAYVLIDSIVDNYFKIIETLGEKIEDLEDEILETSDSGVVEKINHLKKEMNYLRKIVRPAREAILDFSRIESDLVSPDLKPFLHDLQDLTTQVNEVVDTYREMLTDQLNIYNSNISNKMNEVMKVLTIFAAIFIPLTFIAGIYGTNFEYLPELHFKYSYFIFWGILIAIASIMLVYFKKKKWF